MSSGDIGAVIKAMVEAPEEHKKEITKLMLGVIVDVIKCCHDTRLLVPDPIRGAADKLMDYVHENSST